VIGTPGVPGHAQGNTKMNPCRVATGSCVEVILNRPEQTSSVMAALAMAQHLLDRFDPSPGRAGHRWLATRRLVAFVQPCPI
jgi:hypothetical protein